MPRIAGIQVNYYQRNGGEIAKASTHNQREVPAENCDPKRSHLNRELMNTRQDKSFDRYVEEKIAEYLDKGTMKDKSIPKINATGSLELVVRANGVYLDDQGRPITDFDVDRWSKATVEWADRWYNPENHLIRYTDKQNRLRTEKVQNIYSAILHLDESTPHIHFMILPIDDHGHLNSKAYRTPEQMIALHDTYHDEVGKEFGLKRSTRKSPAKAKDISRYHTYIVESMSAEAPEIVPGESIEAYKMRADEEVQRCNAHIRNQEVEFEREKNHFIGKSRQALAKERNKIKEISRELLGEETLEPDMDRIHMIARSARKYDRLKEAIHDYPDQLYADETRRRIQEIMIHHREQERNRPEKGLSRSDESREVPGY